MGRTKVKQRAGYLQPQSDNASLLLKGLEAQRAELGPLAEDLIAVLRSAGIKPPAAEDTTTKH